MTPLDASRRAVVVDDRAEARELVRDVLESELDFTVTTLSRTTADDLAARRPHLVVIDLWLADPRGPNGWAIATEVRRHPELGDTGVVLMSADAASLRRLAGEARAIGIVTLAKPFRLAELEAAVDAATMRAARPHGR